MIFPKNVNFQFRMSKKGWRIAGWAELMADEIKIITKRITNVLISQIYEISFKTPNKNPSKI